MEAFLTAVGTQVFVMFGYAALIGAYTYCPWFLARDRRRKGEMDRLERFGVWLYILGAVFMGTTVWQIAHTRDDHGPTFESWLGVFIALFVLAGASWGNGWNSVWVFPPEKPEQPEQPEPPPGRGGTSTTRLRGKD